MDVLSVNIFLFLYFAGFLDDFGPSIISLLSLGHIPLSCVSHREPQERGEEGERVIGWRLLQMSLIKPPESQLIRSTSFHPSSSSPIHSLSLIIKGVR